jgi:hypothetical protein
LLLEKAVEKEEDRIICTTDLTKIFTILEGPNIGLGTEASETPFKRPLKIDNAC